MAPRLGSRRPRRFAPEVIQTSAMDCGPASLKCLLAGFGVSASYGRLREACQTDVDGTSIDTLEDIACQLGLAAEQIMLPVDHVLLAEAAALPALAVVLMPGGLTHFLVLWSRHGGLVQLMDPAAGRRWVRAPDLLDLLYRHTMPVPAAEWREYAATEDFLAPLRARALGLGAEPERLLAPVLGDESWLGLASLDAALRFVTTLVRAGAIRAGSEASRLIGELVAQVRAEPAAAEPVVPLQYWFVRPGGEDEQGTPLVDMTGAVLVRVTGAQPRAAPSDAPPTAVTATGAPEAAAAPSVPDAGPTPLAPELVAALREQPPRPLRQLLGLMLRDGGLTPAALVLGILFAASAVIAEAVLLRGFVDVGTMLPLGFQRLGVVGALLAFLATTLLLEGLVAAGLRRLGRKLEGRLRVAFLEKLPRLGDRYFATRPVSDMAARCHSLFQIRVLPTAGGHALRTALTLVATAAGVIWLDPPSAPLVVAGALVCIAVPLLAQLRLGEQEMRFRTHAGALGQFYLDCLLGLLAVRAHGAERSVRREHEGLLCEWARTGYGMQRTIVMVEAAEALTGVALAIALVFGYLERQTEGPTALLLVYWTLSLPLLGADLAASLREYPTHRNVTLRLLEPLGAGEDDGPAERSAEPPPGRQGPAAAAANGAHEPARDRRAEARGGVAIEFANVAVRGGGRAILQGIDLRLAAGSHVALVGPSGAGKSSLLGVLLGWHRPATGEVRFDGERLAGGALGRLRATTAWVDPAVQLGNRSLLENLRYGAPLRGAASLDAVVAGARLGAVLEKLPAGHQSLLGEGGGLVSGGEGQRVRLGRAMGRADARLVLLDEPFRGLDRATRRALLDQARAHWRQATLLCVTHDLDHARTFERVLVMQAGRLVEDGIPAELAAQPGSCFGAMLAAERAVHERLWSGPGWRRLRLEEGRVTETPSPPLTEPPGSRPADEPRARGAAGGPA